MRRPDTRGFTLVELIIAVTLLAVASGALFGALTSAGQFARLELTRSTGHNLAREKLAELAEAVRQDWWGANNQPLSTGNSPDETITVDGVDYVRSYRVQNVNGREYRRVTMRVRLP